jgi:hypothetical protein
MKESRSLCGLPIMVITERVNIRAAGNVHLKQKSIAPLTVVYFSLIISFVVTATFRHIVIVSDLERLHFPGCVLAIKNISNIN